MSANDNNSKKEEVKSGGLAGMLAAKQKATETKLENSLTPTAIENRVEAPIEVEAKLPDDPPSPLCSFRVFNHRYEFKIEGKVLKPDAKNIYTPTSKEEFEFLRLQVERGIVHFY